MLTQNEGVAYDPDLVERIREIVVQAVAAEHAVTEQRMFGGLAFLVGGHMAVAAGSGGKLMVRVPADQTEALLRRAHVTPMVMAGREIRGWLLVAPDGVRTTRQLRSWVRRGVDLVTAPPPK